MHPKDTLDQRDKNARSYADAIPDDADQDNDDDHTYRDGSLKNECWNDNEKGGQS